MTSIQFDQDEFQVFWFDVLAPAAARWTLLATFASGPEARAWADEYELAHYAAE